MLRKTITSLTRKGRRRLWQTLALMFICWCLFQKFQQMNLNPRCRTTIPTWAENQTDWATTGKLCRPNLNDLGTAIIDLSTPNITHIEAENSVVQAGGRWAPSGCETEQTIAILIPYRDRWNHLQILLRRLHPMLRRQRVSYQIFVIEQAGYDKYNKGMLFNMGVNEALKIHPFECFIFHDVDMLPENDRNIYYCDDNLRHFPASLNEMPRRDEYCNLAGGAIAFKYQNFVQVNGYPNRYLGWGGEDDDFSARTLESGFLITRPPRSIGHFIMIPHKKRARENTAVDMFLSWRARWTTDGLNSVDSWHSKVLQVERYHLFTKIVIDVGKPPKGMLNLDGVPKENFWWKYKFYRPSKYSS